MAVTPDVQKIETEGEYVHVRFRDPDRYEEVRTPDWAKRSAESVSAGSEARSGKLEGEDEWEVTSVLIPDDIDETEAEEQARELVEKIVS